MQGIIGFTILFIASLLTGYLTGFSQCYYRKQLNSTSLPIEITSNPLNNNFVQRIIEYTKSDELLITQQENDREMYRKLNPHIPDSWEDG